MVAANSYRKATVDDRKRPILGAAGTVAFKVVLVLLAFIGNVQASIGDSDEQSCGVYMAESSIKNAGWGVFAGRDFHPGDRMGSKGIGIPVVDPESINDVGALAGFLWQTATVGAFNEANKVQLILPGIAMLANHHPQLSNSYESGLSYSPELRRDRDPMTGSITSYHGLDFIASKSISAGDELFLESKQDWVGTSALPQHIHYTRAKEIVDALVIYQEKHPDLSEEQWIDLLYRMRTELINGEPIAASLLPKNLHFLMKAKEATIGKMDLIDRSLRWLKENGKCLDNIKEGVSTLAGSGRGAFATRFLKNGTVVSPAPLMQIMNKSSLQIKSETNSTQQLLLNYCFGHRQSQVLLCPTTQAALINHNSEGANVEIRWAAASTNRINANVENRLEGLEEMKVDNRHHEFMNSRLSFDFVATKDIQPGDEIFLNYGKEWEDALLAHINKWKRPESWRTYIPSSILNERNETIMLSDDPRMMIQRGYECKIEPFATEERVSDEEEYRSNPSVFFENLSDHMKLLIRDNKFLVWYPCEVLEIDESGTAYKILVYSKVLQERKVIRKLRGVPRSAIRFSDHSYHSDQHLVSSFRHYIPIPDSMFPLRWRMDYNSASQLHLGTTNAGVDVELKENAHLIEEYEKNLRAAKCGIYFAPSNIPHAGFGTYTAVPLSGRGLIIGTELPAVVFPKLNGFWDGGDYIWGARSYRCEYETDWKEISTVVLAVNDGALANFHPGLVNEFLVPSKWDPILDRCTDSGAGAFSDYVHYSFKSAFQLDAGEELFVSYGEQWFMTRPAFADLAMSEHFSQANNIIASIWSMISIPNVGITGIQGEDLLELAKLSVVKEHRTKMALRSVRTIEDIAHAVNRNGTAQFTVQPRSLEWFEEHGQCIDHIYVKDSTIRQAGKGAFSRRLLDEGSTIISAPLITTWGQHMFEINTTGVHFPGIEDINNISLFLNYQFSHPDSSVFFFPINQVIAINHNSDRSKGGVEPNAQIRWATWNRKSTYFLERPIQDLKNEHYSTMVLDVVATRDIQVDEEIFIDYGEEWETAWNQHVHNYGNTCQSKSNTKTSKTIASMNIDKFNPDHHAWSDDHFTVCKNYNIIDTDTFLIVADMKEAHRYPETIGGFTLPTLDSFASITWDHIGFNLTTDDAFSDRKPCLIVTVRSEPIAVFDVVYFLTSDVTPQAGKLFRVVNLPATDLEFIPMPFRSDTFYKGSFRHAIKIPDDVFPRHWKDAPKEV